ncbi:hypothetical protein NEOLEDRAFT_1139995 [Neolentinus lepideus HHB14362 ss-1]|uniref:DUF6534 domain-containing protein n=1 Tax=Neolentinus lepideus HHB14362 ss-1 TaxID=1314782 RepID=A0A165PFD0_9AGAM|nr:hypothetical protein NEOLEDRAFT_1139995 [Neolentinus lepideus HHB14362 ss-1]
MGQADALSPVLIGFIVSTALYGVTLGQTVYYYLSFPKDDRTTKCLVAMFFLMDTVHEVMVAHSQWWYLVTGCNGDVYACSFVDWSTMFQACPTLLIGFTGQWFYISKVWHFKQYKTSLVLATMSIFSLVTGIVYIATCWHSQLKIIGSGYSLCHDSGGISGPVWFSLSGASSVLVDSGIAVSMCYKLYKMTGGKLSSITRNITKYFLASGILLVIVTAVMFVTIWALPHTVAWLGIYIVSARVYPNSILAMLNNRVVLRSGTSAVVLL